MKRIAKIWLALTGLLVFSASGVSAKEAEPIDHVILYFERGNTEVSDAAKSVIATLVERHPFASFRVVGHSDTVGTSDESWDYSMAIARAVADYLEERGAWSSRLAVAASGDYKLAVQTGDEVSEPRNRRVELFVYPVRR